MMAFTLNVLYYILDVKLEYVLHTYMYVYIYIYVARPTYVCHNKKSYDGNDGIYGYDT